MGIRFGVDSNCKHVYYIAAYEHLTWYGEAAGTTYGMDMDPTNPVSMIEIGGLLKDSEFAMRVYGNSMIPNYPAGCVIGLRAYRI